MLNKKFFLGFVFLFPLLTAQLHADDIDHLPFNEDVTARRFKVRDLEGRALTHPGENDREQQALRGKTVLRYDVSAGQFACLFHALQTPRQSLIKQISEASNRDDPIGTKIRNVLRPAVLENLGRAEDALDPTIDVTKPQVRHFLTPFAQNGVFTPYEVALAYGILHNKKVFVWQYQQNKEIALLACNQDNFPEHVHIGYYPGHFQRLVLEDALDLPFNKAKSLLIERRVGTPLSSFLTDNELARLRNMLAPKPRPQVPVPVKTTPPVVQSVEKASPQVSTPFKMTASVVRRVQQTSSLVRKPGLPVTQAKRTFVPQQKGRAPFARHSLTKLPVRSTVQKGAAFMRKATFVKSGFSPRSGFSMRRTFSPKRTFSMRSGVSQKRTFSMRSTFPRKTTAFPMNLMRKLVF